MKYIAIVLAGLMLSAPAFAEDDKAAAPELRELINCFPSKGITKFVSKFQNLDAEKRDTVDMLFDARFKVNDGGAMPKRIFIRDEAVETDFTLEADGRVPDFINIGKASETAELCSEDPTRVATPRGGEDMSFSISNDVHFLENTGYHDLATLKEGLKDGKSHYKKMAPAAMRMLVPKLTYVMIEYDDETVKAEFAAMKGEERLEGLESQSFCDNAMIKIKDLEALGADGLKVMGGTYNLTPVPGPKMLAKFAGCAKDDSDQDEQKADEN